MSVNVFDYEPVAAILKGVAARKEKRNLVITADEGARFGIRDLWNDRERVTRLIRQAVRRNGGFEMLRQPVGLTDSPQFASRIDAQMNPVGILWWFPSYEAFDEWECLRDNGQVVFRYGATIRPEGGRKHKVVRRLHEDLDFPNDWHGAMQAWFTVAGELAYRNVDIPSEWQYTPPMSRDPREHEDPLFEECTKVQAEALIHAGNVIRRYVRGIERLWEREGRKRS